MLSPFNSCEVLTKIYHFGNIVGVTNQQNICDCKHYSSPFAVNCLERRSQLLLAPTASGLKNMTRKRQLVKFNYRFSKKPKEFPLWHKEQYTMKRYSAEITSTKPFFSCLWSSSYLFW